MRTFLGILLFLTFGLSVFSGCTRSAPETSKITVKMPGPASQNSSAKILASQSMGVVALNNTSKWKYDVPTTSSQINCYALAVQAGDLPNDVTCHNTYGSTQGAVTIAGVYPADAEISIDVTSGPQRTIILIGFFASDPSKCVSLGDNGGVLDASLFSPPRILARTTMDLTPGDVVVPLLVPTNLTDDAFEECSPRPFAINDVEAKFASGTLPGTVNIANPNINIDVEGYRVDKYSHVIVEGQSCANVQSSQYPVMVTSSQNITANASSLSNDGYYSICVLAKTLDGSTQVSPTKFTFYKDTTAPATPLVTPPAYGNTTTPTVIVSGASAGDTVNLYYNNICTYPISVAQTPLITGDVSFVSYALGGVDGPYYYYSQFVDGAGNPGPCSSAATYTLDQTPPYFLSSYLTDKNGVAYYDSPVYSWEPATDTHGVTYKVALGQSGSPESLLPFTSVGTSLSYYLLTPLALSGGQTYLFTVRACDPAGNCTPLTDSWQSRVSPTYQVQSYIKSGSTADYDQFGFNVAIDGEYMVVGKPYAVTLPGSAYVYKRSSSGWNEVAILNAATPSVGDQFGYSVAISGDTIAIGANKEKSTEIGIFAGAVDDSNDDLGDHGAVYIFKRTVETWSQQAYIKAPYRGAGVSEYFGQSVALDGNNLLVGAHADDSSVVGTSSDATYAAGEDYSGAVHMYTRTGNTWNYAQYFKMPANIDSTYFGSSVDIEKDTVVIGAVGVASATGAVYIFNKNAGDANYSPGNVLTAFNPEENDQFGSVVRIFNNRIVVAAAGESSQQNGVITGTNVTDDNNAANAGAVYVFKRNGQNWDGEAYLKAANSDAAAYFGSSVDIFGSTIIVGAFGERSKTAGILYDSITGGAPFATNCGAAYVFRLNANPITPAWEQKMYLKAGNGAAYTGQQFGYAVGINGTSLVVGANGDKSGTTVILNDGTSAADYPRSSAGAVYVFEAP